MKKIISITPVISWCSLLQAQDIKRYVQENAVRVNSNQPDSIEFSDIIAISNAIDDSRIVFMGEQNQSSLKTYTIGFTSYEGTAAIL